MELSRNGHVAEVFAYGTDGPRGRIYIVVPKRGTQWDVDVEEADKMLFIHIVDDALNGRVKL